MIDLSIIVPVYNVEEYIRPCLESLYKQGLNDNFFEVIIVNDGTKDNSMEMIADIINQHNNIAIIHQENQGLSVARNHGIVQAKGNYILMLDSDDLLIDNSLKPLLDNATESQADMVIADFLTMTNEEIKNFGSILQKELCFKKTTGKQLYKEEIDPNDCHVWHTLYRRDFLINNNLSFYPGIRYQDIPFAHECYLIAGKCLKSSHLLTIYRKRPGAATSTFTEINAKDFSIALAKTWDLIRNLGLAPTMSSKLQGYIWTSFTVLIRNICFYIKHEKDRIRFIDIVHKEIYHLHFQSNMKQHFISSIFRFMPHTFIRLCYRLRNF